MRYIFEKIDGPRYLLTGLLAGVVWRARWRRPRDNHFRHRFRRVRRRWRGAGDADPQPGAVNIAGITVAAGNVWPGQGGEYMFHILDLLKRPQPPLYAGAETPLIHTAAMAREYGAPLGRARIRRRLRRKIRRW